MKTSAITPQLSTNLENDITKLAILPEHIQVIQHTAVVLFVLVHKHILLPIDSPIGDLISAGFLHFFSGFSLQI